MTRYQGPDSDKPVYECKYVRVENVLSVTRPNDLSTHHPQLAEGDGLADEVSRLTEEGSDETDAGFMRVDGPEHEIWAYGNSASYPLLGNEPARIKTAELICELSPGFSVIAMDASGRLVHSKER